MLKGKNILIGVTGSIAAFKIPYLVRLFVREGAEVQLVMTPSAKDFVTPLSLSTLSKRPVYSEAFDPADGTWHNHVELGRWADAMLIAPASANTLAKMANGIADNFLLTCYLSARNKVYFAPAMDLDMYHHASTQASIARLQEFGNVLIEPQVGELASGLSGAGRMEEPEMILEILRRGFAGDSTLLGIKALVTAGPTFEPVDPVRYIGNRSSGLMGYEIARALIEKGAEVSLISGPSSLEIPAGLEKFVGIETADEMNNACKKEFPSCNLIVMSAAIADYRPASYSPEKIKKDTGRLSLELEPTADVLSGLAKSKKDGQYIIGFALETRDALKNARAKLDGKDMDIIVLNSLKDTGAGFGPTNKISIISKSGDIEKFDIKPKSEVASDIVASIIKLLKKEKSNG